VALVTGAYAKRFGPALDGAKVVIQGFGNVGAHAAHFLDAMGAKVIAVADIDGAVLNTNGLDIAALNKHVAGTGSVAGFPGGEPQDPATLLEVECDYLVPAALGGVITQFNAEKLRTKVVVEAANSPTTTNADAILNNRGIKVIPDILANAGGVTVSYFEWVQNIQQYRWTLERVNGELESILLNAFNRVMDRAVAENVSFRLSAYLIAIEEVVEATKLRGVI